VANYATLCLSSSLSLPLLPCRTTI
jgi:hypothetical protein